MLFHVDILIVGILNKNILKKYDNQVWGGLGVLKLKKPPS